MTAGDPQTFRWWFLPSWMALDAPCVVTTWCLAMAHATGRQASPKLIAVLFLVVWSIYLADRMMDVARCPDWSHVSGRMQFGRRYRWLFAVGSAICGGGLLLLVAGGLPAAVVWRGAFVGGGMAAYFALFVWPVFFRDKLPGKEFGVGLFFALGCFCVLGAESRTAPMLVGVAVVVAYNCFVIAARDRDVDRVTDPGAASQWWGNMDRDLTVVGVVLFVLAAAGTFLGPAPWFYAALAGALLLLVLLHRRASHYSPDAVRALADFCLLAPWPVICLRHIEVA